MGPHREGDRIRRIAFGLAIVCFLLPFAVYLATLAPTLSWRNEGRDGGDLLSAICTLGIAHPPGYPLYVLLGRSFVWLPIGDPAYRVNLMSAFCGAATVAVLFLSGRVLAARRQTPTNRKLGAIVPFDRASLAALAGALAFAFSSTFWSQATITEVYTLGAFLVGVALYLWLRLPQGNVVVAGRAGRQTGKYAAYKSSLRRYTPFFAIGLVAGLSLTHHLASAIWLAGLVLWGLLSRPRLPARPADLVALVIGFLLSFCVYLYLPLRAAAHPATNWGAAQTWDGFVWVITAAPYRSLVFGMTLAEALGRIPALAGLWVRQFGMIGLALGLAGMWAATYFDRGFLAFSLVAFAGSVAYAVGYDTVDSFVYLIPAFQVFALWITFGFDYVLEIVVGWQSPYRKWLAPAIAGLLLLGCLSSLPLHYAEQDISQDRGAYEFAAAAFGQAEPGAVLLAYGDEHTFALWYYRDCVADRPDVAVLNRPLLGFEWYQGEMRRLYPALAWPDLASAADPVGALVVANLDRRPIYLTELDNADRLLAQFQVESVGNLHRLKARP